MDEYEYQNLKFYSGVSEEKRRCGYYDMEIMPIEKMLKQEPENYNLRIINAELYTTFELLEQAIVNWEIVCKLNPREFSPFFKRGNLLFENGQYDEALNCYNIAIENCFSKQSRDWIQNKRQEWIKWYETDGKLSDYKKSIKEYLKPMNDLVYAGLRLCEINLDKGALEKFDEALAINQNYTLILLYKGNLLSKIERYEDAIESYDKAIKINPTYAQLHFFKAITLVRMRNFEDALKCYDNAINLKKPYSPAIFYKAKLLYYSKRYEDSKSYFKKLTNEDYPFSVDLDFINNMEREWSGVATPYYR